MSQKHQNINLKILLNQVESLKWSFISLKESIECMEGQLKLIEKYVDLMENDENEANKTENN